MTDHLEVRRHVLELLGHVLADLAQTATTGTATTGLASTVVMGGRGLGAVHMRFARQVRRQAAVDHRVVGGGGFGRSSRRLGLQHHCAVDQRGLRSQLLARCSELSAHPAQQLQLELFDHQLEQRNLAVACLDHTQQALDGVGLGSGR